MHSEGCQQGYDDLLDPLSRYRQDLCATKFNTGGQRESENKNHCANLIYIHVHWNICSYPYRYPDETESSETSFETAKIQSQDRDQDWDYESWSPSDKTETLNLLVSVPSPVKSLTSSAVWVRKGPPGVHSEYVLSTEYVLSQVSIWMANRGVVAKIETEINNSTTTPHQD